jgi:hypothetical protein
MEISVSESLNVEIAGSGKIRYRGNPQHVRKSVAGSGKIEKID